MLCICHIYIYRFSRSPDLLLCPVLTHHPLLRFSLGFSLSPPRYPLTSNLSLSVSLSVSVYPSATGPFLSSSRVRRWVPNTHTEARSLRLCLCYTNPPLPLRPPPLTPLPLLLLLLHHLPAPPPLPTPPPRVLAVRAAGRVRPRIAALTAKECVRCT